MAHAAMTSATAAAPTRGRLEQERTTRARNMVGTAIQFGLALMVTLVMMLVTGLFVVNVPISGAFSSAINTTISIGQAGYIIVAVTLLIVPVGGIITYFATSGLGRFMNQR